MTLVTCFLWKEILWWWSYIEISSEILERLTIVHCHYVLMSNRNCLSLLVLFFAMIFVALRMFLNMICTWLIPSLPGKFWYWNCSIDLEFFFSMARDQKWTVSFLQQALVYLMFLKSLQLKKLWIYGDGWGFQVHILHTLRKKGSYLTQSRAPL